MENNSIISNYQKNKALLLSFIAFTTCFAVWTIFSIIGISIKKELGLNDTQFGVLLATPMLTGSLIRLIVGIWADQYGGKIVFVILMIISSISTWLLTLANTYYTYLFIALGVGMAGGSFAVGIAYVSVWFPKSQQGTALGIYGMGNVGAAITNFVAPMLLISFGWHVVAKIYSVVLLSMAIIFLLFSDVDPKILYKKSQGIKPDNIIKQLEPLKNIQVWRFSLYYFFVFGAFLALALWLPRYYIGVYGLPVKTAGILSALYSAPGSVFRAFGGWASDKWGARKVMYWTFIVSVICLFFLSYPSTEYIIQGVKENIHFSMEIPLYLFVVLTFILGFFMSLGKAAVYKHIPVYYSDNVGSVGGIVGLIGGLGGFILPILFGYLNDTFQIWTTCFMVLFIITFIALFWMHFAIRTLEKNIHKDLDMPKYFPELDNKK
ncbi:MAG: NarK/NasA family nitrate transporter [Candidatus Azosocius agrarius]|nr:MAG: NarK/NasA family nitrate transporter [Gammaproteobacteria bacterium]